MKASHPLSPTKVLQQLNSRPFVDTPVSELGKVEERLGISMGAYLLPCKAETGVRPDTLPVERREFTPGEIRSSVTEPGKVLLNHVTVEGEANGFSRW
ncbi:hypothetical protein Ngar_c00820 [Candidatus Nitrososphaera gargensis Ga9.2]|uniref:Uncharacterized protein n=1 Tax=Nitrososphaera gargensis (strain Ga9.2) TaxID=1237085 RepID=K0IGS8_NITGG|nr:hypothetical protein Ngar_c00820 [Candidatus Nitrososphaera gargensis Ga9.2]